MLEYKSTHAGVIGDKALKKLIYEEVLPELSIEKIIDGVVCYFNVDVADIRNKMT